jgi:hypothetical protein
MLCFVRYLPAAIGHLVPANNKVWAFYLLPRQIMDTVFAPSIVKGETKFLEVFICE